MIEAWNAVAARVWRHGEPALLQTTVVALLVLVAMRVGRRWPAPVRHGLAVIALLKFAVPTLIPSPIPFAPMRPFAVTQPDARRFVEIADTFGTSRARPSAGSRIDPAAESTFGSASTRPTVAAWALALYGLGALFTAGWIGMQARRLRRCVRAGLRVTAGPLHEMVEGLGANLRWKRKWHLVVSTHAQAPAAFGCLSPTILIPRRLVDALPPAELRPILAHEIAHHRRGDLWMNALQCALSVVWWFDPLFWSVSRALRHAREDCCDDAVLTRGIATPFDYCDLLLRAARATAGVPSHGAIACQLGSHPLGWRLSRILRPGYKPEAKLKVIPAAVLGALALGLLPGAASRSSARIATEAHDGSPVALDRSEAHTTASARTAGDDALRDARDANAATRALAARTLGALHATEAIPVLVALLEDDAPLPQAPAWTGDLWSPRHLTWSEPSPGESAAISLASMSVDAAPALIAALRARHPSARRNAAWALGELHAPRLRGLPEVPPLLNALRDEAADVRAAAAWALGETKDHRATVRLCAALEDRNAAVRRQAARALGELADARAGDALRDALDDANPAVRRAASWALDEITDRIGAAARRRGD
jgi:beta-lactamase regulating signal transducer with metallopeptidase domain/HEAT repeat protein